MSQIEARPILINSVGIEGIDSTEVLYDYFSLIEYTTPQDCLLAEAVCDPLLFPDQTNTPTTEINEQLAVLFAPSCDYDIEAQYLQHVVFRAVKRTLMGVVLGNGIPTDRIHDVTKEGIEVIKSSDCTRWLQSHRRKSLEATFVPSANPVIRERQEQFWNALPKSPAKYVGSLIMSAPIRMAHLLPFV